MKCFHLAYLLPLYALLGACGGGGSGSDTSINSGSAGNSAGSTSGSSSGTTPNGYTGELAYVSDNEASIHGFQVNAETGTLTPVPGNPTLSAGGLWAVAVERTKRFAYAITSQGGYLTSFAINPGTGALTPLDNLNPIWAGGSPVAILIDPTGHFIFVANSGSNSVSIFAINADGSLTQASGSPFTTGSQPAGLALSPSGSFLYVTNELDSSISAYTVNTSTGQLTQISGSPFPSGGTYPQSITVDATGRFAYVANFSADQIHQFDISATTGALSAVPCPGGCISQGVSSVAADKTRNILYSNFLDMSVFNINPSTGILASTNGGASTYPPQTSSFALDSSGKFLYTLSNFGDVVTAYYVDATTGALSSIPGGTYPIGAGVLSITLSP